MLAVLHEMSLEDNASEAAQGLGIDDSTQRPRTFAVMVAALAAEGWTGRAAAELLGTAMDGYEAAELAKARRAAESISNPWAAWADTPRDASEAAGVLRRLLRQHAPTAASMPAPGGVTLDLDAPPAPPRWLVPDFIVRGKTHMLHGPTHALKSGLIAAMLTASLTGRPFLGRKVEPLRWLIIDGENSREDLTDRLRALGLRSEHLPNLHLTTREAGVRLGDDDWNEWLRREADAFRPDVIVLDTVARTCAGVDSMNADSVVALYANVLAPLVDRHDCALLYTAHDRKSGGRAGTDDAANGSVQWAGQAEQTLTVTTTGALELTPQPDGTTTTRRKFSLRRPKGRTLTGQAPEHFEVHGRLAANGALVAFELVQPGAEPSTVERLLAELDTPLGTGALAKALGLNRTGDKLRKAIAEAIDGGLIVKNDGLYERVAA